jgi:hypothetical protein
MAPCGGSSVPEDRGPAGDAVDPVQDIIQPRGQHVDVFTVERRDERLVESGDQFQGHLIGLTLQALDGINPVGAVGTREEFLQVPGGLEVQCRYSGKQVEESPITGQEAYGLLPGGKWRRNTNPVSPP